MRFQFLQPFFLWALPLMAIPVILHWLHQRKPRSVEFSYVAFVRQAMTDSFYRFRMRRWLLLAIRTLMLGGLVLLFARPRVSWRDMKSHAESRSVVILADASYSMSLREAGLTNWERLKVDVESYLRSLRNGERVGLIVFSDRIEASLPPSSDYEKIRETLSGVSHTFRPTDVGQAVESALRMMEHETNSEKAILLFSDAAEHGWRDQEGGTAPGVGGPVRSVPLVILRIGHTLSNRAVERVEYPLSTDETVTAGRSRIRAWNLSGHVQTGWSLFSGEQMAVHDRVVLDRESRDIVFMMPNPTASQRRARFALASDNLALDDEFYFTVKKEDPYGVLVVNGEPGLSPVSNETYYLENVLRSLEKSGLRYRIEPPDAFASLDLSDWKVLILCNPGRIVESWWPQLVSHLERGGGLWMTAGSQVSGWPSSSGIFPAQYVKPMDLPGERVIRVDDETAPAPDTDYEYDRLEIRRILQVQPAPGARVLLATKTGRYPLLVTGPYLTDQLERKGRTALLTTTIDRDWTNLPSKPLFPALCREVLGYLAGEGDEPGRRDLTVDEPYSHRFEDKTVSSVQVSRPDGVQEKLPVEGASILYPRTNIPGHYSLRWTDSKGKHEDVFAVNVVRDKGEGDLKPVGTELISRNYPLLLPVLAPDEGELSERINKALSGQELFPYLITLLFVLLLAETWLVSHRK